MVNKKAVFLFFCVLISESFSWTVDLAEVRKEHFKEDRAAEKKEEENKFIYDNINDNSPLTRDTRLDDIYQGIFRDPKYAEEYEYTAYRNKEDMNQQGSKYLEGLRQSIDKYARTLDYCSKQDFTQSSSSEAFARLELACRKATRSREHVRRLAELAMFTTKQLQDLDFQDKYRENDVEKEKELLLKLALFLDQLAQYTGFEPRPVDFEPTPPPSTTTFIPPTLFPPIQVPDDVRLRLLNCLNMTSSDPATERCSFPLPLPPFLRRLLNMTDSSSGNSTTNSTVPFQPNNQQPAAQPLTTSRQLRQVYSLLNTQKLSTDSKSIQKRSIDDDPLQNVLQYYLKYNVWINSNLKPIKPEAKEKTDYNVDNELKKSKTKKKRSIVNKKSVIQRIPEDPMQILKTRDREDHNKMTDAQKRTQLENLKTYLNKIHFTATEININTKHSQELVKKLLSKRSVHYERPIRPMFAQDPYQDISSYVKSQPGRNIKPDLIQVAEARAGVQRVFDTGNIEVVRRYGANYNPLDQFQYLAGVVKTISDI